MGGSNWPARGLLVAVFAVVLLAAGCRSGVELPRGLGDPHVVGAGEGVCRLLSIREVQVAVNQRIAGSPVRSEPVEIAEADEDDEADGDDDEEDSNGDGDDDDEEDSNGDGDDDGDEQGEEPDDAAEDDGDDDVEGDRTPTAPGQGDLPEDVNLPDGVDRPGDVDVPDEAELADRGAGGAAGRHPSVRPILPGMRMCQLGSGSAGAVWGVLAERDVDDEEELSELFDAYRDWHGDALSRTRVEGNRAVWDATLRTLVVHADEHVFALKLHAQQPPVGAGDADAYFVELAGELAGRALGRLER